MAWPTLALAFALNVGAAALGFSLLVDGASPIPLRKSSPMREARGAGRSGARGAGLAGAGRTLGVGRAGSGRIAGAGSGRAGGGAAIGSAEPH